MKSSDDQPCRDGYSSCSTGIMYNLREVKVPSDNVFIQKCLNIMIM